MGGEEAREKNAERKERKSELEKRDEKNSSHPSTPHPLSFSCFLTRNSPQEEEEHGLLSTLREAVSQKR